MRPISVAYLRSAQRLRKDGFRQATQDELPFTLRQTPRMSSMFNTFINAEGKLKNVLKESGFTKDVSMPGRPRSAP